MKQGFLLIFSLIIFSLNLQGQETMTCIPDTTVLSDSVLIWPLPFDPVVNPEGGITDTACLNTPYETIFSLRMPDTLTILTLEAAVTRVEFATTGAVDGLPEGITYECNPPNCVFEPGVTGCLVLKGTPTNEANLGENPLTFTGLVVLESGFSQNVSFPDNTGTLPESFVGQYTLNVSPEGSESCLTTSANYISQNISLYNSPNPFSAFTHIRLNSQINEQLEFSVSDFMGRKVHAQMVNIIAGDNTLFFNGENLPQGIYIYSLANAKGKVSDKMILSRN